MLNENTLWKITTFCSFAVALGFIVFEPFRSCNEPPTPVAQRELQRVVKDTVVAKPDTIILTKVNTITKYRTDTIVRFIEGTDTLSVRPFTTRLDTSFGRVDTLSIELSYPPPVLSFVMALKPDTSIQTTVYLDKYITIPQEHPTIDDGVIFAVGVLATYFIVR